jgi:hypothetical protein
MARIWVLERCEELEELHAAVAVQSQSMAAAFAAEPQTHAAALGSLVLLVSAASYITARRSR